MHAQECLKRTAECARLANLSAVLVGMGPYQHRCGLTIKISGPNSRLVRG